MAVRWLREPGVRLRLVPEQSCCLVYRRNPPALCGLNLTSWLVLTLCDGRSEEALTSAYREAVRRPGPATGQSGLTAALRQLEKLGTRAKNRGGGTMIEPRDLLRGRVAPAPLAIEMPTEIRTDGGLMLQILQAPAWAGMDGAAVFAEWSCGLQHDKLAKLRDFLAEPSTTTGLQPEAAIDQALRNFDSPAKMSRSVT